jgi:DNA-directed RNA polymerase subunit RPC12/RpoP
MALFGRRRTPQIAIQLGGARRSGQAPDLGAEIQRQLQHAQPGVFAHSDYVKQVGCPQCGAAKRLPSKTAYLYCDHCGSLIDYDFRAGNYATNAALTNQVFAYLMTPVQPAIAAAIAAGDRDRYRQLMTPVYTEWIRQCPQAVSPRANSGEDFRRRTITYFVEGMVSRDFDPTLAQIGAQLQAATDRVRRIPQADGTWLVDDSIWPVAELFKRQVQMTYRLLRDNGILELEPEHTPIEIQARMEYSYFCQNWLPKLPPAQADRFLAFFDLTAEYTKVDFTGVKKRKCGVCGDELHTVPEAQAVICESCGRKLDIAGGEVGCSRCGAGLSLPIGVDAVECPYCRAATRRV